MVVVAIVVLVAAVLDVVIPFDIEDDVGGDDDDDEMDVDMAPPTADVVVWSCKPDDGMDGGSAAVGGGDCDGSIPYGC